MKLRAWGRVRGIVIVDHEKGGGAAFVRRSASYVDRILKGEKPADLPVQAPVKFELSINLTTAKKLGLEVPLHLQQLADEIIE
jgi:ABC-type uncharacterized transport system substrate-binding protein